MHIYLLPFARIKFFSPQSPHAVFLLLQRAVPSGDGEANLYRNTDQEYFGSIWERNFLLQRNLNYKNTLYPFITSRNPFVPLINGKTIPFKDESTIIIISSFSLLVILYSAIFYLVSLSPLIYFIIQAKNNSIYEWNILYILIFPLILYFIQIFSFSTEIENFKQFLKRVVRATTQFPPESFQ